MNAKRKRFCHEYLKDSNATQAAIRAGFSPKSAKAQGSRLLTFADIRAVIEKLSTPILVQGELTLEGHLATLAELRDEAREAKQFSAAINAEGLRGKARGLYVERHTPEDLAKMSDDELERLARGQSVKLKLA